MQVSTGAGARTTRRGSDELRSRLVEAAIAEFAAHGFEGASTRAIATRANAHQPQINYHFDSKDALWRAAITQLLTELDALLEEVPTGDPRETCAGVIRALVAIASQRPELNRMMIHEGTAPSERLDWLVESMLRPRADAFYELWDALAAQGRTATIPRELVYHMLIGASALLHANAPEARLLQRIEPSDPSIVAAHADALVELFLPTKGP